MKIPLATYLKDHQAGAVHAIEVLKNIEKQYSGKTMGEFAASLLGDIRQDQAVLSDVAERVGARGSGVKGIVAHLGERGSRLKLRRGGKYSLGLFESLEFIELGIRGKWALWRALGTVAAFDNRLAGFNFEQLSARAEDQQARVEKHRLELAQTALLGDGTAVVERSAARLVAYCLISCISLLAINSLIAGKQDRKTVQDGRGAA